MGRSVSVKSIGLPDSNSGWVVQAATAINDRGQTVGYGFGPSNPFADAFLLTPVAVPEPPALCLFGLGTVVLLGYGWLRGRLDGPPAVDGLK